MQPLLMSSDSSSIQCPPALLQSQKERKKRREKVKEKEKVKGTVRKE